MSPRPDQVPREKALDNPTKNRSEDFLPSEGLCLSFSFTVSCVALGDRWRVLLKGDLEDYIHAVVVNVRVPCLNHTTSHTYSHTLMSGLQAAESLHHSSESHAVHCQGFLEGCLRQEMWSDSDSL